MPEPNFSQREGIEPLKKELQITSMDDDLRNGLWNTVSRHYLPDYHSELRRHYELNNLFVSIYEDFLKEASDQLPFFADDARRIIRDIFYGLDWNRVYDFVEFLAKFEHQGFIESSYAEDINAILNREFSGYVFVSGKIMPRISELEITEIEKASSSPLDSVNEHIKHAISLMSNREKPDYRNSIKESISAVESICKKSLENPKLIFTKQLILFNQKGK